MFSEVLHPVFYPGMSDYSPTGITAPVSSYNEETRRPPYRDSVLIPVHADISRLVNELDKLHAQTLHTVTALLVVCQEVILPLT
jgi:hypothetical protein